MIEVLVTGKNSYIGNAFASWMDKWPEHYHITKTSVRNDNWRSEDWTEYDAIVHVAGIAHNSSDSSLEDLYYQVNRDLTFEIAKKAKNEGVVHFINMSSIIVFGTNRDEITMNTAPNPDNFYGDSKLQAEKKLNTLIDDTFKVAHIRPPMVYGPNSKGNFSLLAKLALKTPIFPNYENKRSMIYIKNLTEFIRRVIDTNTSGYLHPQNPEFVKTSDLVVFIGIANNHKILITKLGNIFIKLVSKVNYINKVFGNLFYNKEMYDGEFEYQRYNLRESVDDIYSQDIKS